MHKQRMRSCWDLIKAVEENLPIRMNWISVLAVELCSIFLSKYCVDEVRTLPELEKEY